MSLTIAFYGSTKLDNAVFDISRKMYSGAVISLTSTSYVLFRLTVVDAVIWRMLCRRRARE